MLSKLIMDRLSIISNHLTKSYSTMQNQQKDSPIIVEYPSKNLGRVTINKPSALNAIDLPMIRIFNDEVTKWNNNPNLKALVFKGAGAKAFSAGGDVKSLYDHKLSGDPERAKLLMDFFREEYYTDYQLANIKPIQVSFWDGIVMGGGVGVSIHSKIKIATETTMFAMPEAKLGFFTDVAGGYFLSRLRNNLGYYLGLTGQRLKGEELVQVGLADYYVKRENLNSLEQDLINKSNELTLDTIHDIINKYKIPISNQEYKYEKLINEYFNKSSVKDIYKSLKNSKQHQEFCESTLKLLNQASPLSLNVIYEQIKRGKTLNLADNFKMDFRITHRFAEGKEFFEGIRCVLVDKNSKPNWTHKSVEDVKQEEIEEYFKPLTAINELNL